MYNENRIKLSLGVMSPVAYRHFRFSAFAFRHSLMPVFPYAPRLSVAVYVVKVPAADSHRRKILEFSPGTLHQCLQGKELQINSDFKQIVYQSGLQNTSGPRPEFALLKQRKELQTSSGFKAS